MRVIWRMKHETHKEVGEVYTAVTWKRYGEANTKIVIHWEDATCQELAQDRVLRRVLLQLFQPSGNGATWSRYKSGNQSLDRPWELQEREAPTFQDNRHMKVVKSALRTARFNLPGNIPGTHFCWRLGDPSAIVRPEGLSMKKFHWHHRESNPLTSGL